MSDQDVMVRIINHCIARGPAYKKFSLTVYGLPVADSIIKKLETRGKQYVEYSDDIEMNIEILKISIGNRKYDAEYEIHSVEISHRDSGISGVLFEYRYHLDQSGDVDRFVFINEKGIGRH